MKTGWIRRVVCALWAFAWPMVAWPEGESRRYTLEDCLRMGLEQATAIANARREEGIAHSTVGQARAQTLPHLALSANYTRLDKLQTIELGETSMEMGTLDNYSILGELNQLLYSGGKIRAAIRAARLAEQRAKLGTASAETDLVRDIHLGFYAVLLAQSAVKVQEESVAQLTALYDQTRKKAEAGKASDFDLLSSKVRLANEKPRLIQARNTAELAMEGFRMLVNLDERPFELDGSLKPEPFPADLEALQKTALSNRAAIRQMETTVELKQQDVTAAQADAYPSVSAFASYNGANSYRFVSFQNEWEWHWNAGLALQWSLLDGGLRRATVTGKALELENLKASLDEMKRAVRLEVRQACLALKHAEEQIQSAGETVALAEDALKIAKARHESGLSTYLEFTDANLACQTAKLQMNQALHDHMAAAARLRHAAGIQVIPPRKKQP